eukprot:TRINITY_DN3286_c0_g1_i2.p1 TRINITY_DN3286_c0_g1~~TRINITY_DN3286_c0_g1_i2.p1  ORF type:complete len:913 (+),score=222.66 TRINITY_DN3286_c0_g1_i2:33-2771(+)
MQSDDGEGDSFLPVSKRRKLVADEPELPDPLTKVKGRCVEEFMRRWSDVEKGLSMLEKEMNQKWEKAKEESFFIGEKLRARESFFLSDKTIRKVLLALYNRIYLLAHMDPPDDGCSLDVMEFVLPTLYPRAMYYRFNALCKSLISRFFDRFSTEVEVDHQNGSLLLSMLSFLVDFVEMVLKRWICFIFSPIRWNYPSLPSHAKNRAPLDKCVAIHLQDLIARSGKVGVKDLQHEVSKIVFDGKHHVSVESVENEVGKQMEWISGIVRSIHTLDHGWCESLANATIQDGIDMISRMRKKVSEDTSNLIQWAILKLKLRYFEQSMQDIGLTVKEHFDVADDIHVPSISVSSLHYHLYPLVDGMNSKESANRMRLMKFFVEAMGKIGEIALSSRIAQMTVKEIRTCSLDALSTAPSYQDMQNVAKFVCEQLIDLFEVLEQCNVHVAISTLEEKMDNFTVIRRELDWLVNEWTTMSSKDSNPLEWNMVELLAEYMEVLLSRYSSETIHSWMLLCKVLLFLKPKLLFVEQIIHRFHARVFGHAAQSDKLHAEKDFFKVVKDTLLSSCRVEREAKSKGDMETLDVISSVGRMERMIGELEETLVIDKKEEGNHAGGEEKERKIEEIGAVTVHGMMKLCEKKGGMEFRGQVFNSFLWRPQRLLCIDDDSFLSKKHRQLCKDIEAIYGKIYPQRRIVSWCHEWGTGMIVYRVTPSTRLEIECNWLHMSCLILFNIKHEWVVEEVCRRLHLPLSLCGYILRTFSRGKYAVLRIRMPDGELKGMDDPSECAITSHRSITPTCIVSLNEKLSIGTRKKRIRVHYQIARLKRYDEAETVEENISKDLEEQRQHLHDDYLQALIVRVVKNRGRLKMNELMNEVMTIASSRFYPKPSQVASSVHSVIKRNYIARDPSQPHILVYQE